MHAVVRITDEHGLGHCRRTAGRVDPVCTSNCRTEPGSSRHVCKSPLSEPRSRCPRRPSRFRRTSRCDLCQLVQASTPSKAAVSSQLHSSISILEGYWKRRERFFSSSHIVHQSRGSESTMCEEGECRKRQGENLGASFFHVEQV